jgi:hypothetical protein
MHSGPLAFLGGMTKGAVMKEAIAGAVRDAARDARQVEPRADAATGALLLARKP